MSREDVVGTVVIEENVTREMVDDILTTAFEGGINYWCHKIEATFPEELDVSYVGELLSHGVEIDIHCEDGEVYQLTLGKFILGLQDACNHYGWSLSRLYDDHDAEIADIVVQYALFTVVVYG